MNSIKGPAQCWPARTAMPFRSRIVEISCACAAPCKVKLKIGPVSATFTGEVTLSELNPPHSYVISGSGKGGVAGGATGSARVDLEPIEDGAATRLTYEVDAAVTGKIAQLGSRLIESTAKKLATKFFTDFISVLSPEADPG